MKPSHHGKEVAYSMLNSLQTVEKCELYSLVMHHICSGDPVI